MEEKSDREKQGKKRYVKPEMRQIPLRPEEAVLANCKIAGTAGPVQAQCTIPTNCSTPGS